MEIREPGVSVKGKSNGEGSFLARGASKRGARAVAGARRGPLYIWAEARRAWARARGEPAGAATGRARALTSRRGSLHSRTPFLLLPAPSGTSLPPIFALPLTYIIFHPPKLPCLLALFPLH
jgi:hypothetical protein